MCFAKIYYAKIILYFWTQNNEYHIKIYFFYTKLFITFRSQIVKSDWNVICWAKKYIEERKYVEMITTSLVFCGAILVTLKLQCFLF